jgi:hypothetical protein
MAAPGGGQAPSSMWTQNPRDQVEKPGFSTPSGLLQRAPRYRIAAGAGGTYRRQRFKFILGWRVAWAWRPLGILVAIPPTQRPIKARKPANLRGAPPGCVTISLVRKRGSPCSPCPPGAVVRKSPTRPCRGSLTDKLAWGMLALPFLKRRKTGSVEVRTDILARGMVILRFLSVEERVPWSRYECGTDRCAVR